MGGKSADAGAGGEALLRGGQRSKGTCLPLWDNPAFERNKGELLDVWEGRKLLTGNVCTKDLTQPLQGKPEQEGTDSGVPP